MNPANSQFGQNLASLVSNGALLSKPQLDQQIQIAQQLLQGQATPQQAQSQIQQSSILPKAYPVTQNYGNYNPDLEVFSNGIARDTNFGAKLGDTIAAPPVGRWRVVNQNTDASQNGYIGNGENSGYGRAILLQNLDTNERLHYIHLDQVATKLGDVVQPGQILGKVGKSGNLTSENLGMEYYDQNGKISDVLSSPYASYLMPQANQ